MDASPGMITTARGWGQAYPPGDLAR